MALRMLGVPADDPALVRARTFILARGGISSTRIFTKMHLALIGAYDWAGLPALPPALMMLPDRGPFSIYELSSWARGSTVPLIVVFDRKPVYGPPLNLDELYAEGRGNVRFALPPRARTRSSAFFLALDGVLKLGERNGVVPFRAPVSRAPRSWTVQRQEATGDWGGIIPAMLNAMLALRALGYDAQRSGRRSRLVGARRLHDRRRGLVSRAAVHLAGLGYGPRGALARRRRRAAQRQAARSTRSTGCWRSRSSRPTAIGR